MEITERDRDLLAFAAEHRLIRTDHVGVLLGVAERTADERLRRLCAAALLRRTIVLGHAGSCHQITRRGLATIASPLPAPRLDVRTYDHDIGIAWVWLAARAGAFGPLREIVSERGLRSRDGPGERPEMPLAVRIGGVGPRGGERLHYPDLLLVGADARRIAVELELSSKSRLRRERILMAYGADPRIETVLYLVASRRIGAPIAACARQLGIASLVHVQTVARPAPASAAHGSGRVVHRRRARVPRTAGSER